MFTLTKFGAINLPAGDVQSDMGSLETLDTAVQVAGGQLFDAAGYDTAPADRTRFTLRATELQNTAANLEAAHRALLAQRGKLARLYRTWEASTANEWIYARLVKAQATNEQAHNRIIRNLTVSFESRSPHWNGGAHGACWHFDEGYYFDTGLFFDCDDDGLYELSLTTTPIHLPYAGTIPTTGVMAIVTPAGSPITALTISSVDAGVELVFTGSIAVGQALIIDGTKFSVTNGGLDAYVGLDLGAGHTRDSWFHLEDMGGSIQYNVTRTGGNGSSTIQWIYYDAHG